MPDTVSGTEDKSLSTTELGEVCLHRAYKEKEFKIYKLLTVYYIRW